MTSVQQNNCAQTIVIIEWVLFTILTALQLFFAIYLTVEAKNNYSHYHVTFVTIAWIFAALTVVIGLIMTGILTHGVYRGHPRSCKTWYAINIACLVLGVVGLVRNPHLLLFGLPIYLYRICAVKIIIAYTSTLATSPGQIYAQREPTSSGVDDPPPYSEFNERNANVV